MINKIIMDKSNISICIKNLNNKVFGMAFRLYEFSCPNKSNLSLSKELAFLIGGLIAQKNTATLAVSGGKSPIEFFKILSQEELEWQKVNITLVDERIVKTTHADSNTALVHNYLLCNKAQRACFIPLLQDDTQDIQALLDYAMQVYRQPDIAILGMGLDGHTASLFPQIKPNNVCDRAYIVHTIPKDVPYQRLSMSFFALEKCQKLFLLISGREKRAVFDRAALGVDESLPISYMLHSQKVQCDVYYAE